MSESRDWQVDRGGRFSESDVVQCYRHRPDYPPELFAHLLELMPRRAKVLDLGCGPGKIARGLASQVDSVTAIDMSSEMIDLGRSLPGGGAANIRWLEGAAESFPEDAEYALAVAAASVHWMDHERLFARLRRTLSPDAFFVCVDGDGANLDPPWAKAYEEVIGRWVERLDGSYDDDVFRGHMTRHEAWLDRGGTRVHEHSARQSIDDFISCQHSRATFARHILGPERSEQFDEDLRSVLSPHADEEDHLEYRVATTVAWYRIPAHP